MATIADLEEANAVMQANTIPAGFLMDDEEEELDEEDLVRTLSRVVSETLDEDIEPDYVLTRRMDSRMICNFNERVREAIPERKVEMQPRAVFDFPTIRQLAGHLKKAKKKVRCVLGLSRNVSKDSAIPEDTCISAPVFTETAPPKLRPFTQLVSVSREADVLSLASSADKPLYQERATPGHFERATDGMDCVWLPACVAWIGEGLSGRAALDNEMPCHEVKLGSFLIDVEPVSVGAFARFLNVVQPSQEVLTEWLLLPPEDKREVHVPVVLGEDGAWKVRAGAREAWPMIMVSWYAANAYSLWANRKDWTQYKSATPSYLPTEAQWEYAARGADVASFPWGDAQPTPDLLRANWSSPPSSAEMEPIGALPLADVNTELGVSPLGPRHMAGNVWQWCRDTYDPAFYRQTEATADDAWNQAEGPKSERGGSWVGPPCLARSSYRRGREAISRGRCLGFRCIGDSAEVRSALGAVSEASTATPRSQ